jgi:hypothetical protein
MLKDLVGKNGKPGGRENGGCANAGTCMAPPNAEPCGLIDQPRSTQRYAAKPKLDDGSASRNRQRRVGVLALSSSDFLAQARRRKHDHRAESTLEYGLRQ